MAYLVSKQSSDGTGFGSTLKKLAIIKLAAGAIIIVLYNLVYAEAGRTSKKEAMEAFAFKMKEDQKGKAQVVEIKLEASEAKEASTKKPTLAESIAELSKSKELKSMAAMVLSYNICVELTEVVSLSSCVQV